MEVFVKNNFIVLIIFIYIGVYYELFHSWTCNSVISPCLK